MEALYLAAIGPLFWFSCLACLGGTIFKLRALLVLGREKDVQVFTNFKRGWAVESILRFILPLNVTVSAEPAVLCLSYLFHLAFIALGLLVGAHGLLIEFAWGIPWPTMNDGLADVFAVVFLIAALAFLGRRLFDPDVRALSTWRDYLAWGLAVAPVLTGFIAHQQWIAPRFFTAVHALSGCLLIAAIPFTKLAHAFLFFASRAVTGSDFGKRNTGAW